MRKKPLLMILAILFANLWACIENLEQASAVTTKVTIIDNVTSDRLISYPTSSIFTANVTVTDVVDLYGYDIKISYDPEILNVTRIIVGGALGGHILTKAYTYGYINKTTFLRDYENKGYNNTSGEIHVGALLQPNPETGYPFVGYPPNGASGSGWLFTIEFLVETAGTTDFHFDYPPSNLHTIVADTPIPIPHMAFDGVFEYPRVSGAPEAVFAYSPKDTIPVPAVLVDREVTFDASESKANGGYIRSYRWDFGDGNITTVSDPLMPDSTIRHAYSKAGNYTVALIATDNDGLASEPAQTDITVLDPPTISCSPRLNAAPPSDTFEVNATAVYVTKLAKWVVNMTFDPDVLEGVSVTEGPFLQTVGSTSFSQQINNAAGVVYASALLSELPTNGANGSGALATITFRVKANGTTLLHFESQTLLFTAVGTTFVKFHFSKTVDGVFEYPPTFIPPTAAFTHTPERPRVNQAVTFNASDSEPNGGFIETYFWDFGDGTNTTEGDPIATHAYSSYGTYNASLTVTDSYNLNGTTWKLVKALQTPTAAFTHSPSVPIVGGTATFNSTSYDPDGFITNWNWDFNNDGITDATTENTTYTYTEKGNYEVRLTVTDNDTLTNTFTKDITILLHDIVITSVIATPSTAKIGQLISINVTVANNGDFDETFNVVVYYDTNIIKTFDTVTLNAGASTILTQTWETAQVSAGAYTLGAQATQVEGEVDILNNTYENVQVTIVALATPVASFTYSPSKPLVGETVTFNASTSSDSDGTINSYTWNFGDGNTMTRSDPIVTHTYAAAKEYTVTLTVADNDTLTHTATQMVKVEEAQLPFPLYAVVGVVILVVAMSVIAFYFFKVRKP